MTPDNTALYTALASHDPRFDGVFYVGVTSTGIYCRPVCTARTPKAANCRFFDSAVAAEKANFRPCLRCRPELAPGNAPVDDAQRIASLIAHRIDEGMLDDGAGLETIAARFGWSSRQIRRMLQRELGVSPMDLVLTRRLLLAKQLLTDTRLPVSEVAFASGFSSVRRFNDAFNGRYGIPPTQFRKATPNTRDVATDTFTLQLAYRPPLDWAGLLAFLEARAMCGVEAIDGDAYRRTVQLGSHTGWVSVRHAPAQRALLVELPHSLTPVLPALLGRLRHLFDLSARPDVIAAHLSQDPVLADSVSRHPGLRVPGGFDGFELAVRAILGQQITVKAATTIAGRFAIALGEHIETPYGGLDRLAPTAERVARTRVEEVAALGIVRTRAESIVALAREMAAERLVLEPGAQPDESIARLTALPGVGPWTAQYIAMRATRWPDAFPKEDIAARKALGGVSARAAEAASQAWRPWRSYALLHLWQTAGPSRS
ncbi:MAG TPA: AlkA N-terminal domain-containing protein [Gemmatimonadaceae bacterium]|jgi:AraC family transcriptional regulator of adaptative response / DNA-3-methyladenine glycosylase II